MANNNVQKALRFLESIGIGYTLVDEANGFINHIDIRDGILLISPAALVSDILHEAGHLAVFPVNFRHRVNSDIEDCLDGIFYELETLGPEHPGNVSMMHCSDTEATAWAWAAGKHLGIADADIITDQSYEGEGATIRLMLSMRAYFGINGLIASGMTSKHTYPTLNKWVQSAC
jgi:hypothetical protein